MKVAILYPPLGDGVRKPMLTQNRQFRYTSSTQINIFPVVAASAATMLKNAGHEVFFLDGIARDLSMQEFTSMWRSFKPEFLVLETKAPVITQHWAFIDKYRDKFNCPCMLIGDHVTAFPEESLKACSVDCVLTGGDWDNSITQLADHLSGKGPKPSGLYWRNGSKIESSGTFELVDDLDCLPIIDRTLTRWSDYGEAYLFRPTTHIMSGRGCGERSGRPGICTFCVWQYTLWGNKARLFSPDRVAGEIQHLVENYRVKEIFDDNESGAIYDYDWMEEFYSCLKFRKLIGKVILSSNARADALDSRTCSLLKRIGYRLLKIGLESGDNKILKKIGKRMTVEKITEGVKCAKDHGLRVLLTTMVGYPWETEETARKTYKVAKELVLYKTRPGDCVQSSVFMPYPGTPAFKLAQRKGWITLSGPEFYDRMTMDEPLIKTQIDTSKWCHRIFKILFTPRYLTMSFLRIRSRDEVRLAFRGFRSLLGHIKDFGREKERC